MNILSLLTVPHPLVPSFDMDPIQENITSFVSSSALTADSVVGGVGACVCVCTCETARNIPTAHDDTVLQFLYNSVTAQFFTASPKEVKVQYWVLFHPPPPPNN